MRPMSGPTPTEDQLRVCEAQRVVPALPLDSDKAGVALATLGEEPLNGLRLQPEGGTSGWYIWAGTTLSTKSDFFEPLHHHHLREYAPTSLPFLALPPGWRFLVAPDQVDVWFDPALLDESRSTEPDSEQ